MTPLEMEEAIKNLQLQTNRIEEFLPTLSTREELHAVRDEVKRHALVLNEATRAEIKILAENLSHVEATMATKEELKGLEGRVSQRIEDLRTQVAEQVREVTTQVGGLATQVGGLTTQVGSLTTQVGGLTTQVSSLTTQVGGLTTQVGSLVKRRRKSH